MARRFLIRIANLLSISFFTACGLLHDVGAQEDFNFYSPIDVQALYTAHGGKTWHTLLVKASSPLLPVGGSPDGRGWGATWADYPDFTCWANYQLSTWKITAKSGTEAVSNMLAVRLYNVNNILRSDRGDHMSLSTFASKADADAGIPNLHIEDIGEINSADQGGTLIVLGENPVPVYRLTLYKDPSVVSETRQVLCGIHAFAPGPGIFLAEGVKLNKKRHMLGAELLPIVNQQSWPADAWRELDSGVLLPGDTKNATAGGHYKGKNSRTLNEGCSLQQLTVTLEWHDQQWGAQKGGLRVDLVRAGPAPAPAPSLAGTGVSGSFRELTSSSDSDSEHVVASSWIEYTPRERKNETFEYLRGQDDIVTQALGGDHIRFSARVGDYSHKIYLHRLQALVKCGSDDRRRASSASASGSSSSGEILV
eukprot:g7209.t1